MKIIQITHSDDKLTILTDDGQIWIRYVGVDKNDHIEFRWFKVELPKEIENAIARTKSNK